MLALGLAGLAGNVAATWVLASGEREDLNLEGVLRHSAADALSSIGVVVAAALVLAAGWNAADPIASLVIAGLIAAGSWRLLKEPVDVLMEAAPAGTDVAAVGTAMAARARRGRGPRPARVDGHVRLPRALSAHVVVRPGRDRDRGAARASSGCCTSASASPHDAPGGRAADRAASGLIQVESARFARAGCQMITCTVPPSTLQAAPAT